MPLLKHAKKALRASQRKTVMNRTVKSRVKTELSRMTSEPTTDQLSNAFSAIDKALKRNILHRNKAARMKAQLSRLIAQ